MKKIFIIYDFFSERGGLERILMFQANSLREKGYDVKLAFAYVDDKLKKEKLKDFEVIEYGKIPLKNETLQISLIVFRKKVIEQLKEADLIICHSFPASYLTLRLKKKYGIPYILMLHHPPKFLYDADLNWAKNSLKRKFSFVIGKIFRSRLRKLDFECVKNADAYFVASESVKKNIFDTYNITGKEISPPINKGFKIKKYKLKDLLELGISKKYVLFSGRVVRQKRIDYLIKALSKVKNKNLQLVIAGLYKQKLKKELEKLSSKLNVNILFLGNVDIENLNKLYNLAEAIVLTCPCEGFGLTLAEAMACGCPGIAWKDNSGPQEIIIEGKNGYLAKPYNILNLAKQIDKTLNKKWNKKQIADSIKRFSEEKIKDKLIKEVKKVLNSCE